MAPESFNNKISEGGIPNVNYGLKFKWFTNKIINNILGFN